VASAIASNASLADRLSVWQKTSCESEEFFRRIKAAKRLQSRGRVHRRGLGAFSGNCAGISCFRHSELADSDDCLADCCWFSSRARLRLVVRDHAGRSQANRSYIAGDEIASVFVALGDHNEAFRWLNRAVDEHSGNVIATCRELRPLYSDSRFPLVLRRMGIDPTKVVGRQTAK
jgi:hypothetical protein